MTDDGDDRRVPIRCANCGAIAPARLKPDGSIEPIGREMACECDEPALDVLEKDDPADEGL